MKKVELKVREDNNKLPFGNGAKNGGNVWYFSNDGGKTALLPKDIENILGSNRYKDDIDQEGNIRSDIKAMEIQKEIQNKLD
ncbi:hypothetical protein [Weissella fangxianensis]|uniref:hypothetical protein n=1 Tax=Weissella fangxianensis TaxID=2953879 RepID=UPI00215746C2|nr:hypothetical protein [Weissella fangxianensis]